jgi:hypothetical protein
MCPHDEKSAIKSRLYDASSGKRAMGCRAAFSGREAHRNVQKRWTIVRIAWRMVEANRKDRRTSNESQIDHFLIALVSIL